MLLLLLSALAVVPSLSMAQQPAAPTARDTAYLDSLLRANRHPIALAGGRLTGPGAGLLLEAAREAQFFIVGESHYVAEIPRFTAALFDTLHRAQRYNHFAIEYGPEIGRLLSAPGARGSVAGTLALGRRYPHAFQFWNDEELESISRIGATSTARRPIWGLDQEWGALHALDRLAVIAPPHARGMVRALADSVRRIEAVRPFQMAEVTRWISGADSSEFDRLRTAIRPAVGSEAARLLDALEASNRFYMYNKRAQGGDYSWYYRSNHEREEYMKRNFMHSYRAAQAAGDTLPRVLLKFGNVHGGNWVNHLDVHTLGNFLHGFAASNGRTTFHLVTWLVNDPGTYWSITDEPPYLPIGRVGSPREWVVVDLRQVRRQLYSGRLRAMSREMRATVIGFDAVLLIGSGKRGTYDALQRAR